MLTKREKIAGAFLATVIGAASDPYRYEPPWRGALGGLMTWLVIVWLDADPERADS